MILEKVQQRVCKEIFFEKLWSKQQSKNFDFLKHLVI